MMEIMQVRREKSENKMDMMVTTLQTFTKGTPMKERKGCRHEDNGDEGSKK